jgi:four helix bundle protein
MKNPEYVKSYQELVIYQKSRLLAHEIFKLTKTFPKEETYAITSQMRRSSRSIGAQIAEAWSKRLYQRHFISKLTDADGEQQETQHWLDIALDCEYIDINHASKLKGLCSEIGRMCASMISKADTFCAHPNMTIKETNEFYVSSDEIESE